MFGVYLWLFPLWIVCLYCEKVVSLQLLVMVEIRGVGRVSDSVRSGELVSCVAPCEGWGSLFLLAVERRSVFSSLRGGEVYRGGDSGFVGSVKLSRYCSK